MLREADTVGVFQVESRAQMATLPRMKPDHFYDLVVEVAIIRPGPIVGKMVHPYLRRRNGREPVGYLHPSLEPILKRTLGVPLFQEQLLRIAMTVAGFTGGEAEELRRAMGFKRSEKRMKAIEAKLRAGMAERGITGEAAGHDRALDQLLRALRLPRVARGELRAHRLRERLPQGHHPAAFTCALLNNQPMGFYHPFTLVKDAQRHGVRFRPVDVTRSGCTARSRRAGCGSAWATCAGCGGRRRSASRPSGRAAVRVAAGLRRPDGPAARRAAQPGRGGCAQRLRPDAAQRPVAGGEGGAAAGAAAAGRSCRPVIRGSSWAGARNRSLGAGDGGSLGARRRSSSDDGGRASGDGSAPPARDGLPERLASDLAGPGSPWARTRCRSTGRSCARGACGGRPTCRGTRRGARAGGGGGDLPAAAGDGGGVPVPDPRGRDGPRERDREARPLPPRARGAGRRGRARGGRRPAGERRPVGAGVRGAQALAGVPATPARSFTEAGYCS